MSEDYDGLVTRLREMAERGGAPSRTEAMRLAASAIASLCERVEALERERDELRQRGNNYARDAIKAKVERDEALDRAATKDAVIDGKRQQAESALAAMTAERDEARECVTRLTEWCQATVAAMQDEHGNFATDYNEGMHDAADAILGMADLQRETGDTP